MIGPGPMSSLPGDLPWHNDHIERQKYWAANISFYVNYVNYMQQCISEITLCRALQISLLWD